MFHSIRLLLIFDHILSEELPYLVPISRKSHVHIKILISIVFIVGLILISKATIFEVYEIVFLFI